MRSLPDMPRLGGYLYEHGLITADQLEDALQHQIVHGARLGTNLVELQMLRIEKLAQCLSELHKVPLPPRKWLERPARSAIERVTRPLVERIRFIPMRLRDKVLHVATLDPRDPGVLDDLRFATGCRIEPYVLPEIWMHEWLEQLFRVPRGIRYVDTSAPVEHEPPPPRMEAPEVERLGDTTWSRYSVQGEETARRTAEYWSQPQNPQSPHVEEHKPPPQAAHTTAADAVTVPASSSRTTPGFEVDMGGGTHSGIGPHSAVSGPAQASDPTPAHTAPEAPPGATPASATDADAESVRPPPRSSIPTVADAQARPTLPAGPMLPSTPTRSAAGDDSLPGAMASVSVPSELRVHGPAAVELAPLEREMLEAETRDRLLELTLRVACAFARRVALFSVHQGTIQGIGAVVDGRERELDGVLVPLGADSMLSRTALAAEHARVDPRAEPIDARLVGMLGEGEAKEGAAFVVMIKRRVVNLIYADNGNGALASCSFGALEALAVLMGRAYEQLILRRKGA